MLASKVMRGDMYAMGVRVPPRQEKSGLNCSQNDAESAAMHMADLPSTYGKIVHVFLHMLRCNRRVCA